MSAEFPIVAITGSSGSGSSSVIKAFEHIFWRTRVKAIYMQGNAFHRYDRREMKKRCLQAIKKGESFTHFSPKANHLDKLESIFFQYEATGTGSQRFYLHSKAFADKWKQKAGTFTPWIPFDDDNDLLLYRGLHGATVTDNINIVQYPDLLLGITPNVNLEWIRKIKRDTTLRGYSAKTVQRSIVNRIRDYAYHITPQFTRTDVNFQMIPMIDTSDPFMQDIIPAKKDCLLVIHFQKKIKPNFDDLLSHLPESYMSRPDTIVLSGDKLIQAIEIVFTPVIHNLVNKSRKIRHITKVPKSRGAGVLGLLGQSMN